MTSRVIRRAKFLYVLLVVAILATASVLLLYVNSSQLPQATISTTRLITTTSTSFPVATTTNNVVPERNQTNSLDVINYLFLMHIGLLQKMGNMTMDTLAVNNTITIPSNTAQFIYYSHWGHKGILEFDPNLCVAGEQVNYGNSWQNVTFMLGSQCAMNIYSQSLNGYPDFQINSTNFAVYFQNVESAPVTLSYFLIYDYYN